MNRMLLGVCRVCYRDLTTSLVLCFNYININIYKCINIMIIDYQLASLDVTRKTENYLN